MRKEDLRIVFMGTPDFAVESLRILTENNYNIVGVITVPDKPGGRGHKIQFSSVKKYALEHNLPLLQPEKLKDESFINSLKAWNADLQIVVAFRMLPEIVWNMPRLGTFNLHGSLLPQYRGAAPINRAIINGEKETGVTTFFLSHEIDTGRIIFQEKIPISETDNAGIVHDELMKTGSLLVKKTVDAILENKINSIPQEEFINEEVELKPAPKIFKETCHIDWSKYIEDVYNLIRGLSPYPTAWCELVGDDETVIQSPVKIYSSEKILKDHSLPYGTIGTDNSTYIHIAVKGGFIDVRDIQFPGKKSMKTEDLLRGYKIPERSHFR
ncbi:MAG: methionyl-tRNA formyltransferase [Dysgonomonas sp.]